jgi:hypothetical protein
MKRERKRTGSEGGQAFLVSVPRRDHVIPNFVLYSFLIRITVSCWIVFFL